MRREMLRSAQMVLHPDDFAFWTAEEGVSDEGGDAMMQDDPARTLLAKEEPSAAQRAGEDGGVASASKNGIDARGSVREKG